MFRRIALVGLLAVLMSSTADAGWRRRQRVSGNQVVVWNPQTRTYQTYIAPRYPTTYVVPQRVRYVTPGVRYVTPTRAASPLPSPMMFPPPMMGD